MIKIIKKFASKNEINELNSWTFNNYKNDFFVDANMGKIGTRLTTRYHLEKDFDYPKISYEIKSKIIKKLNLTHYFDSPIGKNGIVNGIGFNGGDIFEHIDPSWFPNTYTVHCNLLTQKPYKGGTTIINNVHYDIDEGDLLIYCVSELKHQVSKIEGNRERVLWCFSFSLYKNYMNKIFGHKNYKIDYE